MFTHKDKATHMPFSIIKSEWLLPKVANLCRLMIENAVFLKNEGFGMRSDSTFYNNYFYIFDLYMKKNFEGDINKIETIRSFEHMGSFVLRYMYLPHKYMIEIENEIKTFNVRIYDDKQAFNSLHRIKNINCSLEEKNISNVIYVLKEVLIQNDFDLYFHKDGKFYRKNSEGIKRIKDLKELLNG